MTTAKLFFRAQLILAALLFAPGAFAQTTVPTTNTPLAHYNIKPSDLPPPKLKVFAAIENVFNQRFGSVKLR